MKNETILKKKCSTCGKEFFKLPTKSLKKWNEEVKYCSRKCSQTLFKKGLIPWNKGKTGYLSESSLKRMSDAKKGKHTGREFKRGDKTGVMALKKWRANGGVSWNKGKKTGALSKEWRRKISESLKGKKPKNFDDLMRRLRSKKPTGIEIKVYEELKRRGFLFERQKVVGNRYVVDAYIPSLNLVIEADGDYWHSKPKTKERDKRKNCYLKEYGFNLLRLTETEINNGSFKAKL